MEQENRVQQIRTRWAEIRALVENFIDSFAQPGPGAQEVNDQQQLQVVHPQQQEADAPGADQWDEAVGEEQYEEDDERDGGVGPAEDEKRECGCE